MLENRLVECKWKDEKTSCFWKWNGLVVVGRVGRSKKLVNQLCESSEWSIIYYWIPNLSSEILEEKFNEDVIVL